MLTAATGLLCRTILTAMQTPEEIFADAYSYIFVIFMGIPASILYNLLAAIMRSLGDSKTPVYFLALASILNIGLDFAFILLFRAGVAGAAIATVLSQALSGLACLAFMVRRFPILRMQGAEKRFDLHSAKVLCWMGIPMGLQYSITAVGSIILQSAVNGLGTAAIASVAAGAKLFQLICCPYDAMGSLWPPTAARTWGPASWTGWDRGCGPAPGWGWAMPCWPWGPCCSSLPVRQAVPEPG